MSADQWQEKEGVTKLELTVASRDGVASEDIEIHGARTTAITCVAHEPGAAATSDLRASK